MTAFPAPLTTPLAERLYESATVSVLERVLDRLLLFLLPFVATIAGVYFLRKGYRLYEVTVALTDAAEKPLRDVTPEDEFVHVTGVARPAEEGTTEAELLGEDALLVHTTVESPARTGKGVSAVERTTDHESTDTVPFILDDGTDQARVEVPDGGVVRLRTETETKVTHDSKLLTRPDDMSDDVPVGVQRYVRNHDVAPTSTRWYCQGAVRPDETVSVVGPVTAGPTGFDAPPVTITSDGASEAVVVSNKDDFETEIKGDQGGYLLVGGLLFAVGFGLLVLISLSL